MPASRSAEVVISNTTKVAETLQGADDFMTIAQLAEATKLKPKSVMTAIRWLVQAQAVESIMQAGRLYFMATPENDRRLRTCDQHRKEDEPRVVRASRRKPR